MGAAAATAASATKAAPKQLAEDANYMDVEKFAAVSTSIEEMPAPEHSSDCKTMKELDAWFKKQKAILKKYVPSEYEKHYSASLEKTYKSNAARIKAVAAATAASATKAAPKQLAEDATST